MTIGNMIGFVIAELVLLTWAVAAMWSMAAPRAWRQWLFAPGRRLTLFIQVGATIAFCAGVYGQVQPQNSRWRDWSVELISVSVAVLVIDTANRRRAEIEFKQSVIRQLGSLSHDFALEAARIVVDRGWHEDGSLKGANLEYTNLKNVYLQNAHLEGACLLAAHLEGAFLWGAHLQGANLAAHLDGAILVAAHLEGAYMVGAHLENAFLWDASLKDAILDYAYLKGALYNAATVWPNDFDPVAAGAILIDDGSVPLSS